jgi:hypothetical protein
MVIYHEAAEAATEIGAGEDWPPSRIQKFQRLILACFWAWVFLLGVISVVAPAFP